MRAKIHILKARGDNYIYILTLGKEALVVDPSEAGPVARRLKSGGLTLRVILVTHHHGDHTAGCASLKSETGCTVIGPPGGKTDRVVQNRELFDFAGNRVHALYTPGHTRSHICYHLPEHRILFTGDTLFVAGCGRLTGCSPAEMWASLKTLRSLPGETRVYCGHDYTLQNLEFSASVDPDNPHIRRRLVEIRGRIDAGEPTVPSTIAEELLTNPFLRADNAAVQASVKLPGASPVEVFAHLRREKDYW